MKVERCDTWSNAEWTGRDEKVRTTDLLSPKMMLRMDKLHPKQTMGRSYDGIDM